MAEIPTTNKWVDLSLIHPRFKERLEHLFMDSRVKGHVAVCSGCRSYAEQKRLYDKYRTGRGNLAANPDWSRPDGFFKGSFHQEQPDGYSYAVDLSAIRGFSKSTIAWVAAEYGIRPTVKGEWWHFQPRDGNDWFPQTAFEENYTTPGAVSMDWAGLVALHAAITKSVGMVPLRWGSRGIEVKVLQKRFNAIDFWCGTADGVFGRKTWAATRQFQRAVLMPVTGRVGATAWYRMWNLEIPDGL